MRKSMVNAVTKHIDSSEKACLLLADTGAYAFREAKNKHPERVIDIGIMEDGLVGIAAGMSLSGMVPTIYAMTPFVVERSLEQLKLDFVYQKLEGNIITIGAAYDFSMLGYSHYCAEDYAILKNLPGIEFVAPGCGNELSSLYEEFSEDGKLTYVRMSDYPNKICVDVRFGRASVIKTGDKGTIIAVGTMLDAVMEASLDEDVTVLYYTTLSPFDKDTLIHHCKKSKILVCEPHFIGSLDSEILSCFPGKYICVDHVGLPIEVYRNYGTKKDKDTYYGLTTENIKRHIINLVSEGRN